MLSHLLYARSQCEHNCAESTPGREIKTSMPDISASAVAVIGGGSIGVAFAVCFARGGMAVRLHEPDPARRERLPALIDARLRMLDAHGLLDEAPEALAGRVAFAGDLGEAVEGAAHVQECAPEKLDLKQALFADLDRLAPPDAVLASSSSAIPASRFAGTLAGRERALVAHPGNPPFLIPMVEIVPAPFTAAAACLKAEAVLARAGLKPVRLNREVEGFVFNRLQGAVLREAYCLVRDGVASAAAIDLVMREGLAPRWSVVGPFETADLNTQGGIASHAEKMGPAYASMGAERGQDDPWTAELVGTVAAERRAALPLADWEARVAWRDDRLAALQRFRRDGEAR